MTMSLFYVKKVQRKLQSVSLRCKECCKCFSKQRNLRIHERFHTGKKPHECGQCGKCFNEAGKLKMRERIHAG